MNICNVYGPSHRDDGAPGYFLHTWGQIGHHAFHRTILDSERGWEPWHFCIEVDWARDVFPELPDWTPPRGKPAVCIQSDTHWSANAFKFRLEQSRKFDLVFVNQIKAVEAFRAEGVKAEWLPHAASHTVYTPILKDYTLDKRFNLPPDPEAWKGLVVPRVPKYDWSFVGHVNTGKREEMLGVLVDEFPSYGFFYGYFFEDAAKVYASSKIAFNVSVNGDLNMRCFEVCATGTMLLTDRQDGMEECGFKDGETCVIYEGLEDAIEKMRFYLAHAPARDAIARKGYELVLSRHTYQHRAKTILDRVQAIL